MKTVKKRLFPALALVLAATVLAGCRRSAPPQLIPVAEFSAQALGRVISAAELRALIDLRTPNLVIIGVISPFAALDPSNPASTPIGGSYLIWREDITSAASYTAISPAITGMRASLQEIETLLSRAGVTGNSRIVVYSAGSMTDAGRLMWQLDMLGLANIHYLDGGLDAWIAAGQPTGAGARLSELPIRSDFQSPNYDPARVSASFAFVLDALLMPEEWVVIDARSPAEHAGLRVGAPGGAFGTGRIAGTVNIDWTNNINPDTGLIRRREELLAIYGDVIRERNVIVFCHSGLRAGHTWFVLSEVLGHDKQVLNWDGSWIEWSFAASVASQGQFPGILELTEAWTCDGSPF